MLRGVTYSNGKVKQIDFQRSRSNKNLIWIYCSEASLKELDMISRNNKIPLFELKHSLDPREKPRICSRKKYSLIIFRAMNPGENDKKTTFPVEFIITKNLLITLTPEKNQAMEKIFQEIDGNLFKDIKKNGFGLLVFRILLKLLGDYEKYFEEADDTIDYLEDASLQAKDKDLHKLLNLKGKLIFLRRSLTRNKDMLNEIGQDRLEHIKSGDMYRELYTEYSQLVATEELIKDRVTGVMEMFLSSASNNLNKVMKSFTVIASILLIPMVISGAYGMNLILPLGDHPQGFIIILLIIAISMILMFVYFRVKNWV